MAAALQPRNSVSGNLMAGLGGSLKGEELASKLDDLIAYIRPRLKKHLTAA